MLFSLAFLGVGKARVRSRIARTNRLVIAGLDPLLVTTGLDPVVHAEWPSAIWTNECSAKLYGSPGQARR
jgi:hypothetical protein